MGRGRQKAKHTKVARELKYFSPDTDYNALERELSTDTDDSYADIAAKYADLDDDESDSAFEDAEEFDEQSA